MGKRPPTILIVGTQGDALCQALAETCNTAGMHTRLLDAMRLADLNISLGEDLFLVDGRAVGGIFFHASPESCFSTSYAAADRSFSDAETRAIWLAALNMRSVAAINRYDASTWFEGFGWSTWRQRLQRTGIPVAPVRIGGANRTTDHWQVYHSGQLRTLPSPRVQRCLGVAVTGSQCKRAYVAAGGTVLHDSNCGTACAAAMVLHQQGLWLVEIFVDQDEAILGINPVPAVQSGASLQQISSKASRVFHEHLNRRRH